MIISIPQIFAATSTVYLEGCLAQRQPGEGGAGSRFVSTMTLETLSNASWAPYAHPDVQAPAQAFRAEIPGHVGVFSLDLLPRDSFVMLRDRKGTGFLEAEYGMAQGPRVEHTTLLIGPDRDDPNTLVVWTFFPGDPIMPSRLLVSDAYRDGTELTVEAAIASGLVYAKAV